MSRVHRQIDVGARRVRGARRFCFSASRDCLMGFGCAGRGEARWCRFVVGTGSACGASIGMWRAGAGWGGQREARRRHHRLAGGGRPRVPARPASVATGGVQSPVASRERMAVARPHPPRSQASQRRQEGGCCHCCSCEHRAVLGVVPSAGASWICCRAKTSPRHPATADSSRHRACADAHHQRSTAEHLPP